MCSRAGTIQAPVVKEEEFPSLGADFPSLGAAVTQKKERKKKQTMSLGEFVSGGSQPRADLLMSLPTAPRARKGDATEGEEETLGGAFKSYGGGQQQRGRFEREDRPRRQPREDDMPSRADAVNDWGAERKFMPSGRGDSERRGFGGSFREREERPPRDGPSRADLVDDWGANRPRMPSPHGERRGRRDGSRERVSKADLEDRWGHKSDAAPTAFDDRPRRTLDDNWRGSDAHNGSSEEAPRERPKLKLKPRSKPLEANDTVERSAIFGDARPREAVLEEQNVEEKIKDLKV